MKTKITKLPKSEIEISFELDEAEFSQYWEKALEHVQRHFKADGFRRGNVPAKVVEKSVGQENILMEAGDLAVKAVYPSFMEEQNLEPVGNPSVQIKKIAKGSPFEFMVKVSVLPEVALPDYKKIASSVEARQVSVGQKEVEDAIEYLQKSRATFTDKSSPAQKKDYVKITYQNPDINGGKEITDMFILGDGGFLPDFEEKIIGMEIGQSKEFTAQFPKNAPNGLAGKQGAFKVTLLAVQTMEIPELTDEFAKNLGSFESIKALQENLKEGIALEKQASEKQRRREEILEKISKQATIEVSEEMIGLEERRLMEDLKTRIKQQFAINFEEYLASIKKTEEEIKESFRLEAEKRIRSFLVLRQIGKAEAIAVTPEELAEDLQKLIKRYTPEQQKQIDIEQLTEYSKGAIFNEKIFQLLENFSQQ